MSSNPLLDTAGLPLFDQIKPEHVTPAVDVLLKEAEAALEKVTGPDVPPDYDALSLLLDVTTEKLGRAWGAVGHLNSVADTPELRAAYNENLPRLTEFYTRLGSDERLYAKYKALVVSPEGQRLSPPRARALDNVLRGFVLGGAELQGEAKARYAAIQEEQAASSQAFSEHVMDATDAFSHYASLGEMAGVPQDVIDATRAAAQAEGKDGHKLTLHMPCYLPVMQYATHRPLRETLYRAYATRASEFGHGLHHMLTKVEDIGVAGISGVEWDAVELPSQFMENFCWEWAVVQKLTHHVDSGESLPLELFTKMIAAKNFQSGMMTLRQIEFSLFDMRLHAEPGNDQRVQQVVDEVRLEVAVNIPPAFNRFQHSFSHIFSGGYSAGYYSYKWAEVLSADAYAAFEEAATPENGVLNAEVGRRYRQAILEAGGSRSAMDNFKAFRGREPSIDALLRHQGMA